MENIWYIARIKKIEKQLKTFVFQISVFILLSDVTINVHVCTLELRAKLQRPCSHVV